MHTGPIDWRYASFCAMKTRSSKPRLRQFGDRLKALRGTATRQEISNRLEALHAPLGGSTLAQYENGAVWAPDVAVLWGLSQIYKVSMDDLVDLLRTERARVTVADAAVVVHIVGQGDAGADSQEVHKGRARRKLKSLEDDTLGGVSDVIRSDHVMAHRVPNSSINATGESGRSLPPASPEEPVHAAVARSLAQSADTLLLLGEILSQAISQLDDRRKNPGA